ncbi:MAG: hypothetical protein J0L93_08050 [Deltaproteobacteria bacterium]|nr:hypothetical protein [Deltaproteobacteria bacterium]
MKSIFFILFILVVGRLVYFLEPLGISVDESTYLAVAEAWNHYGKLYVDAIDRKPPLVYGLYYQMGSMNGFWNINAVHFWYFCITFILCLLAEAIARKIAKDQRFQIQPWFTAILFAIISSCFSREFISANSEIALLLPLGFSFWILIAQIQKYKSKFKFFAWMTLASTLAALATLLKQIACLPFAFAIIFWAIVILYKKDFRKVAILSLSVALGVAIVYGATAYLFLQAGTFEDFVYWNLSDNFAYLKDSKLLLESSRPLFSPIFAVIFCWPTLVAGLIYLLRNSQRKFTPQLSWLCMAAATLGAFAIVYVAGRLYSHYFVPVAWFLTILAAPGVYFLIQNPRFKKLTIAGLAIPFTVFFLITTFRDEIFQIIYPNRKVASFDKNTQKQISNISQEIKQLSQPEDRIVVWGMASQIYVASERGSGTRFIPADYVSGRLAGFASSVKNPSAKAMALYLQDFANKKPKLFIDTSSASLNDYQYFPVKDYPELYSYLKEHYDYLGIREGFGVWKLKG